MANRPFDLKAALSGEPVMIDGDVCRIEGLQPERECMLVFRADKSRDAYFLGVDGLYYGNPVTMAPRKVKKTVWVNLYKPGWQGNHTGVWMEHDREEDARIQNDAGMRLATAVPVEIEVEA